MNTDDDIEYCKFCIDKPMILGRVVGIKYSCRHCPNSYKRWDNGGNGWMFIHEKYTVDVYSNFSQVFFSNTPLCSLLTRRLARAPIACASRRRRACASGVRASARRTLIAIRRASCVSNAA